MPKAKYTGSPMGSGNPPGKHSGSYLNNPGSGAGNFNKDKSYRGDMHVGINETATAVGNQPKNNKSEGVEKYTHGPALR